MTTTENHLESGDSSLAPISTTVTTYADGAGKWRARVDFAESMSESSDSLRHHLHANWARLRRQARTAIVRELTLREERVGEGREAAERRVRQSLPPLSVIDSKLDSLNRWHSVTFGE